MTRELSIFEKELVCLIDNLSNSNKKMSRKQLIDLTLVRCNEELQKSYNQGYNDCYEEIRGGKT